MFEALLSFFKAALGLDKSNWVIFGHMCLRGFIVYFTSVIVLRFNRRFAGIRTPFNFILYVMLGSISAFAITGTVSFLPVYGIILLLMALNRTIASIVFYSSWFEQLIKGPVVVLVKDGKIQWKSMRRCYVTERELLNELHNQLHIKDLTKVYSATLTADGSMNFVINKFGHHKGPKKNVVVPPQANPYEIE